MSLPLVIAFIIGAEIARRRHHALGDRGSCKLGAGLGLPVAEAASEP